MNPDEATTKMKAKLDAFFETAAPQDISALLKRTNYDFYKNVRVPEGATVWVFSLGGQSVRVETSSGDLPKPLWDKLSEYIKVLEPAKP